MSLSCGVSSLFKQETSLNLKGHICLLTSPPNLKVFRLGVYLWISELAVVWISRASKAGNIFVCCFLMMKFRLWVSKKMSMRRSEAILHHKNRHKTGQNEKKKCKQVDQHPAKVIKVIQHNENCLLLKNCHSSKQKPVENLWPGCLGNLPIPPSSSSPA